MSNNSEQSSIYHLKWQRGQAFSPASTLAGAGFIDNFNRNFGGEACVFVSNEKRESETRLERYLANLIS